MAAFAAAFVAVSCSKEQNNDAQQPVEVGQPIEAEQITITATIPAELSKVAMDYTGDALDLTWSVGDVIRVADHANPSTYSDFTLASGEGSKNATFTGTEISASSYDVTLQTTNWPANILAQVQSEDASTAHLGYSMTLSGVNTYKDISFNSTWASSNGGGSFTQSGVLHIQATMPDDVTETIKKVTIVADQPVFGGGINTMTISFSSQADPDGNKTLDVFATIPPTGLSIPNGTNLFFKFETKDGSPQPVYTRYYKAQKQLDFLGGQVNLVHLTCDNIDKYACSVADGSESKPFYIADKYQLISLMNQYKSDDDGDKAVKYWVKLVDDIDLDGVAWIPLNRTGSYGRAIDFDGQGHTISNLTVDGATYAYPSFFGVVYGDVTNVIFESPTINGGDNNAGVVGGYIGTGTKVGNCGGVTVNDATVTGTGKNVGGFGGIIGAGGTISNCHLTGNNTVSQSSTTNGRSAGGFIGNVNAAATITGCTATANVTNTSSYYTGGFIGQVGSAVAATVSSCAFLGGTISSGRNNDNSPVAGFVGRIANNTGTGSSFTNCYVDGAIINASVCGRSGGFVGDFGGSTSKTTITSCHVVNSTISAGLNTGGFMGTYGNAAKCYVDNTSITANKAQTGGFVGYPQGSTITNCYVTSSVTVAGGAYDCIGGFVGICKDNNTITNCYEAATVSGTGTGVGAFIGKVDSAPISVTKCIAWNASLEFYGALKSGVDDSVITNNYTGTSGTISSQATTLGWDGSIWDLTGSVPTLK